VVVAQSSSEKILELGEARRGAAPCALHGSAERSRGREHSHGAGSVGNERGRELERSRMRTCGSDSAPESGGARDGSSGGSSALRIPPWRGARWARPRPHRWSRAEFADAWQVPVATALARASGSRRGSPGRRRCRAPGREGCARDRDETRT
jgi:hypothetical protein